MLTSGGQIESFLWIVSYFLFIHESNLCYSGVELYFATNSLGSETLCGSKPFLFGSKGYGWTFKLYVANFNYA